MQEKSRVKWLFVLPGILWVLSFTVFPLLYSLVLAFQKKRLGRPAEFNFPDNFTRAFSDYRLQPGRIRRLRLGGGGERDENGDQPQAKVEVLEGLDRSSTRGKSKCLGSPHSFLRAVLIHARGQ